MANSKRLEILGWCLPGEHALFAICGVLFAASTIGTIAWCGSMAAMGGMAMPGGWTMSMAWMRRPDQGWPGFAASFVGMWALMMVAMMLPSLAPVLRRVFRAFSASPQRRPLQRTGLVALGYFALWALAGLVCVLIGLPLADATMRNDALASAVPAVSGATVLFVGAFQFTRWKKRSLDCCRADATDHCSLPRGLGGTLGFGIRLGLDCLACCGGLMLVLVVLGIMNIGVMACVSIAIALERLAADGRGMARVIGAITIAAGLFLLIHGAEFRRGCG